ncbi:MAG: hypothetical protein PHV07_06605, partial [Oscillospiraceae bacterium]|nr:hypothetical protein [Oscillospiraceae bacterium]
RKGMEALMTDFYSTYSQCTIVPTEYIVDGQTEEGIKPLSNSIREKFKEYFYNDESLDSFMTLFYNNVISEQAIRQMTLVKSISMDFKNLKSFDVDFDKKTASALTYVTVKTEKIYYDIQWNDDGTIKSKQEHNSNYSNVENYNVGFAQVNDKWLISSFSYYSGY